MQFSFPAQGTKSLRIIIAFLLSFSLLQSTFASPTPERSLAKRYSGTPSGKKGSTGPATSDYPSDDDIRSSFTSPSGPYVFFSQIGSDSTPAYNFAQTKGGVIFRQAFPAKYTIMNKRSEEWYQDFADRFSGVFAEKASGDVYVVSTWNFKIDDCRVWNRIEYPTLKDNSDVESVILVDYTNFANQKVIYSNANGIGKRGALDEFAGLQKRDTPSCFDWDGYGDDPADPDSGEDSADTAYASGWCTTHITQYQKNEGDGDTSEYRYDIYLYDANGETVGSSLLTAIADGATADVDSALPDVFEVTSGSVDSDAVYMAYNGQSWGSNDQPHQCNFGAYNSGNRDGSCGFTC